MEKKKKKHVNPKKKGKKQKKVEKKRERQNKKMNKQKKKRERQMKKEKKKEYQLYIYNIAFFFQYIFFYNLIRYLAFKMIVSITITQLRNILRNDST